MTPAISILIPHLRNADNDKALKVAIDCIIDNTDIDYELIVESVATRRDIYPVLNNMAHRARAEWLVFSNSDVFLAPGWASGFYECRDNDKIVTGVIVECGAIPVNDLNYERNFGRTPETFDRAGFEAFVSSDNARAVLMDKMSKGGRGWYFPCLLHKRTFNHFGGFDTSLGKFPDDPLDKYAWDKWAAQGKGFARADSWCYHLQNYTSDDPSRIHDRFHRA